MSLLKLATEPLQVITKELAIWELAALICTCEEAKRILKTTASVLQAKMPGCISMERPNKLITTFRFLLEVSIGGGGTIPHICPGHIIYLPSTVTTLKLNFLEAFGCFKRGFSAWKPVSATDPFTELSMVQVKDSLPNLRTLLVISEDDSSNSYDLIPGLPASITHLHLQGALIQPYFDTYDLSSHDCPHNLPPNLVTLKLPRCRNFTANVSLKHLVHLQTLSLKLCMKVPRLPPSITKLHLQYPPQDYKLADQLPDLLSLALSCETLPSDFEYPRHLTTLKLRSGTLQLKSNQSVLPPSVTHLCVANVAVDQSFTPPTTPYGLPVFPQGNIVWPPKLKCLDYRAQAEISQLESLPSTLEYTTLTIKDVNLANVSVLSKQLTKLVIGRNDIDQAQGIQEFDLASVLPRLSYFSIMIVGRGYLKIALPRILSNLDVCFFVSPPEGMTYAEMSFTELNSWPPFLRVLQLNESSTPTDAGLMHLPRTLTNFKFTSSNDSIRFTHVGLSHLPNSLTELHIDAHIESIQPDWLHHLPSCLRGIRLDYYDGMRDEHVASLPRCLQKIDMKNSLQLTDACLPYLPPSLTSLKLRRNRLLTPKILDYIPASFLKFSIHLPKNVNFPKRLKNSIPPTVGIFTHKLRKNYD